MAGSGGGAFLASHHASFVASISGSHVWRNIAEVEGGGLFLAAGKACGIGGSTCGHSLGFGAGKEGGGVDDGGGGGEVRQCVVGGNEAWGAADNVRIVSGRGAGGGGARGAGTGAAGGLGVWRIDDLTSVSRHACASSSSSSPHPPESATASPTLSQSSTPYPDTTASRDPPKPPPQIFVSIGEIFFSSQKSSLLQRLSKNALQRFCETLEQRGFLL
jgi:hypothetical protein